MEYTQLTNRKKKVLIQKIYAKVASYLDEERKKELTKAYSSFDGALGRVEHQLPPDPAYKKAPGGLDLCALELWGGLIHESISNIYSPARARARHSWSETNPPLTTNIITSPRAYRDFFSHRLVRKCKWLP